jgi:hypothetical protein
VFFVGKPNSHYPFAILTTLVAHLSLSTAFRVHRFHHVGQGTTHAGS